MPILFGVVHRRCRAWWGGSPSPSSPRRRGPTSSLDLPVEAKPPTSGMRSLGAKLRRFVPTGLVKQHGARPGPGRPSPWDRCAQAAGHPGGAHRHHWCCSAPFLGSALSSHSWRRPVGLPRSPVLDLQPALQAPGGHRGGGVRHHRPVDHLRGVGHGLRRRAPACGDDQRGSAGAELQHTVSDMRAGVPPGPGAAGAG